VDNRILIVDRDQVNRRSLARRLTQRGCDVLEAGGLDAVRRLLDRRDCDVVLLDLRSLGPEALIILQVIDRDAPGIKTILLTSPDRIPLSIQGMMLGAFDDVMTPVDIELLLARVRAAGQAAGDPLKRQPALSQAGAQPDTPNPGREKMEDVKVLIVDDEEEFLQSLSERMELRDLKPELAKTGEQALERVQADEPTVMILDLRMPGMDGLEVLRRVKKAYPKVQVVILTGHGTDKDRKQAEKLGAFAYLQKPVDLDTLLETVSKAHQRFKAIKHSVDTAFMAAALAEAGEPEMAREMMREERGKDD
jgi:two-component system response regulator (stage 0 sporulation protein F)